MAPPPRTSGGVWRLALGVATFALFDPGGLGLLGLPLAGLLLVAGPARRHEWAVAVLAAAAAVATLAPRADTPVDALVNAYVVLVSAAFVCMALLAPTGGDGGRGALRMAVRAWLWGVAGTVLLATVMWGGVPWREIAWQATHGVRAALMHRLADFSLDAGIVDRVVGGVSSTVPALLALETFAGLTLAWQLHVRLAARPLGPALAPFREFRFGDLWVWGVVASITVWLVPALATLKLAALNLAVVLGALYLLRGAAVVVAFASATGIPVGALVLAAAVSALLAVPLLLLLPGLWTLGMTDTWLQFRRRLAGRKPHL
ncbi:MAG: hypothetical protein AUI57_04550 [Candidatus Rokubacteria bacterium 13_1_40CM_2_68_8]|nr:MAG: hypothetical protein AUI57_04550 [Candidatus Rokubacteria bacterium 13_1_40CM_2_68_8]